jgi:hypothetical protein
MADLIKELRSLETRLEKAKLEKAKLEGQKVSIMKEMQDMFEISTIEEGENLLREYEEAIKELEETMAEQITKANNLLDKP